MGNASSNKAAEAASGAYSPTPREGNIYDQSFPPGPPNSRYGGTSGASPANLLQQSFSHPVQTHSTSTGTPPVFPRALERRSHTTGCREKRSETSVRFIVVLLLESHF